jgi:hypothetical protein
MDWNINMKRYGLACFQSTQPDDREGDGDAFEFFDRIEDAQAWAQKALRAGRFKYLVLWDGASGYWESMEEFGGSASN